MNVSAQRPAFEKRFTVEHFPDPLFSIRYDLSSYETLITVIFSWSTAVSLILNVNELKYFNGIWITLFLAASQSCPRTTHLGCFSYWEWPWREIYLRDLRPQQGNDLGVTLNPELFPVINPQETESPCSWFTYLFSFFSPHGKNDQVEAFLLLKSSYLRQISFPSVWMFGSV